MSNQDTISPLNLACQRFSNAIESLSDEQFLSARSGRTPRDVVAHLIGWNSLMIESSLAILTGIPPAYYEDAPNDYSTINAGFMKEYSSGSKGELLAELRSTMEKLQAFLQSLPAEELTASHGVAHHSGGPASVARIIASLTGDYDDHTSEIEEWFKA